MGCGSTYVVNVIKGIAIEVTILPKR